jgi:hypothetical protein
MSEQANSVVRTAAGQAHILAENARYLIATAGRAPSVHNSQPWQFLVTPQAVELWSDPRRKLRTDPIGREMMISCGAALFGLRLGTACPLRRSLPGRRAVSRMESCGSATSTWVAAWRGCLARQPRTRCPRSPPPSR